MESTLEIFHDAVRLIFLGGAFLGTTAGLGYAAVALLGLIGIH